MTKISIIVPIYNAEKYLSKCIDSLLGQTYRNIEIILVNDGSTDSSLAICNKYKKIDDRIMVVNKKNEGVCLARKSGIEAASGELLGFVDSDDYVSSDMYELLLQQMIDTHSDISICGYYFNYITELQRNVAEKKYFFEKDLLYQYLKYDFIECMMWNKLFKKNLFENIVYYDRKKGEDLLTCIQLINNASKMCYINKPLYYYYVNPKSIMRSKFKKESLDELKIYDEQYNFFVTHVSNIDRCIDYLYYHKFNCVIRIIKLMCENLAFIKEKKIINELYDLMCNLYEKIEDKTIILQLLSNNYYKIKKYKFYYFIYLYIYNCLRKIKLIFRKGDK